MTLFDAPRDFPSPPDQVEVLAWRPLRPPKGTLVGFASIRIVGWRFRIDGCPCHAGYGKRWVGLPGRPITGDDGMPRLDPATGKMRFTAFAAFDGKDLLREFSDAAVAALDIAYPGWDHAGVRG